MAGIRVKRLPNKTEERHLKIHFSKPDHGGGRISKIYFPLFNNDAVILFHDKRVAGDVSKHDHTVLSQPVDVEILPEHMVFTSVSAKLDPEASVLVQITNSLREEMEFVECIKIEFDSEERCILQGNWFQLEWAWCYIDCFMRQQEVIQHEITQQPQRYAGTPMEVDESEDMSRHRSQSALDNADFRSHNHLQDKSGRTRSKISGGEEIPSLSYHEDRRHQSSNRRSNSPSDHSGYDETDSRHHSRSRSALDDDSDHQLKPRTKSAFTDEEPACRPKPSRPSALDDMGALKDNIQSMYPDQDSDAKPRRHDISDESDDSLRGQGFTVQMESMNTMGPSKLDRSTDENQTFRQFSGLDSMRPHSPESQQAEISHGSSNHQSPSMSHDQLLTSALHDLNSSHDKSPSTSQSARKPSVDAIDHSLSLARSGVQVQPMQVPDKYTSDQLCRTFNINGLSVTVYFGNLVMETTDAIVNAANEELEFYGGIAAAIQKARGPEMKQELQRYLLKNGRLRTTEAMHTSGGEGIKSSHIIHAVGPMWFRSDDDKRQEENAFKLMKTFLNCLEYANERLWIRSVALPAISSGVYGAPLDICVRCFLDAVLIFTDKDAGDRRLADVRLVNNDAESTVTSIVLIETLLEQGTSGLTEAATQLMQKHSAEHDRRLNLPRGRQEKSHFSKTMTGSMHTTFGASGTDSASANDSRTSTSSARRRSNSVDARPKKKSSDSSPGPAKTSTSSSITKSAQSTGSSSIVSQHRARSGSFNTDVKKSSSKSSLSSTIGGTSGIRYSGAESMKSSPRYSGSSDKSNKSTPKIKSSLFNTTKLDLKQKSPKRAETGLYATTESLYSTTTESYRGTSRSGAMKSPTATTSDDDEEEFGLRSLPADLHAHRSLKHQTSFRDKFLAESSSLTETCAICLDEVRNPKQLAKCKHKFCALCIDRHFKSSKPTCPTCGAMYGRITGTQPRNGRMTHTTDRSRVLPGYEREDGLIVITYTFSDGVQETYHPEPGKPYKGRQVKAFLPNSVEGREVLRLLKRAFDARLVFTIGDSKTRGESGLITWNDIHHKTSLRGGPTAFGYPDAEYLGRVKEELAAVGITPDK